MLKKTLIYRFAETAFRIMFVLVLFILNLFSVRAQEMHADNVLPAYPGGYEAIKDKIAKNLQYPEIALRAGISGSVQVKYTINSEGKIENVSIMRGLSPECDAEAIRVTRLLTGWEPGRRQGNPVDITVTMPVVFKSEKKTNPATISGKVTEKTTGKAIEGAFVIVKGTNVGSVTDTKGSYRIELPAESKDLIIFSVGYSSEEIPIDYHSTINIELETEYFTIEPQS